MTILGKRIEPNVTAHPGQSGFMALAEGIDALAARLGLAMYAEKSLDVQYYIWRGDQTGVAVAHKLLEAADRGVRVRMLLDDLQASVHDPALLALSKHPQIEVRMFNPSAARRFKAFELLSRFAQLNRRMHNKTFIADNQMAIVGGRNIGNEYFNADPEVDFTDFDVLAVGPVVPEISVIFDMYWNSELAIPISALYADGHDSNITLDQVRQVLQEGWNNIYASVYADAVEESEFVREMQSEQARFYWGKAQAVSDSPEKFLHDPDDNSTHMGPQLQPQIQNLQQDFFIVSPYFIPGQELVDFFARLVKRGVRVTVLTNSFASNDVGIVHAGYARYREALLNAGVELYEYKPDPEKIKERKGKGSGIPGSSRASLHAKLFVLDKQQVFVGSLNLDPRSVKLNSELGVIIDNPQLAVAVVDHARVALANNAYRVRLRPTPDGGNASAGQDIVWETIENGQSVTYDSEPNVGFFRSIGIWFMSLFVPEELL